jgi:hypothetical protein
MIRDLDLTLRELLEQEADPGSELASADIVFDLPDSTWRSTLSGLTVNAYLYDIRENRALRTQEPLMARAGSGLRASRIRPPVRVDCSYCITAWSTATDEAVLEEHRLLSQVLMVLMRNPIIPQGMLQGALPDRIAPRPEVIASPEGIGTPPDFWGALDQQLKPSLNYVVTLAVLLDEPPPDPQMTRLVDEVVVVDRHLAELEGAGP